jgi:hypothetical protein
MVRALRVMPALAVLVIALSVPSVALAAPVAWQSVDVTLHSEAAGTLLLVAGELPPATPLPAEAELSVPSGSQIQWIGEILGGDTAQDPEMKYVKSTANGVDVYRFTLTKSRVAQVEASVVGADSLDGTTYATSLKWTPSQDVPSVRVSAAVKKGATIVQSSPDASLLPGDALYDYYSKTVANAKAGTPIDLAFTYTAPAIAPASSGPPASTGQDSTTMVVLLVLVVFVGALIAVVLSSRRKLAAKAAATEAEAPGAKSKRSAASGDAAVAERDGAKAATEPRKPGRPRTLYVFIAILAVAVVLVISTQAKQVASAGFIDGKLKKSFGAASACTSVSIPFTVKEGVDLEVSGGKLMDSLKGLPTIGDVTIYLDPPSIDVGFCESSLSEQQVREALTGTGMVTLGQGAAPAQAPAAEPATGTVAP